MPLPLLGIIPALPSLMGLADGVFGQSTIFKFVNLALGIIVEGLDIRRKLGELDDQIKLFIAENREPTPGEWQSMIARSDTAHDTIQNA